jgi:tetratricopeptide (TPR) repeat protein
VLGATLAVAVLASAVVALWPWGQAAPNPGAVPGAAATRVSALTRELVRKQVRLAQRELEDKDYAAATAEAEGVLRLAPGQPEAAVVLAAARERMIELDRSIAEARRLADAGDTGGASRELSHVLELDPRHPAAAELSARLNSAFRAQADEAAASMRAGRAAAVAAGASPDELRAADEAARRAEALTVRGEYADATRTFLEARDAFDRARRVALLRPTPSPVATPEDAPPSTASGEASVDSSPARRFAAEGTSIATPSAGGIEGFDSSDVSSRRPPQFSGRMEFEVLPPAVRPGEPFVVRIHLRNEGRREVKIRGLSLVAVVDGLRTPAPVKSLLREVAPQSRALVAEYSGVWGEARSWALEAVVTADRNETVSSRLRAD